MRGSRGSSSAGSRRSHRRYHTMAPNSQVDETLFGSPKPLDKRGNSDTSAPKNQPQKKQEGEIIQLVTKDLIRNLRIPFKDPSGESIVLPLAEFERITATSHVLTKEESEALRDAYQRKKDEEFRATEERKRQIHEADLSRQENKALTELDLEARDRAQALLERANALRMEQEEEIKQFNMLILGAQCQATRDAQINEKKQIQAELSEEEKRLDAGMEAERRKALETVEKIDELRKQQRIKGRQQICDQIQQHQEEKQMQDEMKEQEKQQFRENLEKMNLEDFEALEKKRLERQRLQQEITSMNIKAVQAKEQRREDEKQADLRDKEYTRKKLERDAEYEEEQRRIKREREMEIAMLRARQEKAKDYKAEQDGIRARRNQEASDREWRRKEKELSAKKGQDKDVLMAALTEQIHCKEQHLSIEAGREKAEFERVLKAQQEAIIKQKEEEEKQRQKAYRHADSLRTQVKEHVVSAVAKRRESFTEADKLLEEARLRRIRLDEIKERKLKELKATGVPEKYCSEVERKGRSCAL